MEFHVYTKRFCLYYAGFRSTLYPVSFDAMFDCGDFLHNKIFEVCKRTLLLCMHEHYEDCPMREQAQYTMDSRNQMLAGYWVFREHEFAKASIRLMALSIRDDNMLELCSPARVSITIPSFSAIFLTIAAEYLEYTGDLDFILEILPVLERLAGKFISCKEANGLIRCFKEGIYWNFYEWQDGLSGVIGRDTPEDERTYDAPLCAFVSLGFRSLAKIYSKFDSENEKKYTCLHLSMNKSINDIFWDEKQKAYASFMHNGNLSHFCEGKPEQDKKWDHTETKKIPEIFFCCNLGSLKLIQEIVAEYSRLRNIFLCNQIYIDNSKQKPRHKKGKQMPFRLKYLQGHSPS